MLLGEHVAQKHDAALHPCKQALHLVQARLVILMSCAHFGCVNVGRGCPDFAMWNMAAPLATNLQTRHAFMHTHTLLTSSSVMHGCARTGLPSGDNKASENFYKIVPNACMSQLTDPSGMQGYASFSSTCPKCFFFLLGGLQ